jgi:hypothetical protein
MTMIKSFFSNDSETQSEKQPEKQPETVKNKYSKEVLSSLTKPELLKMAENEFNSKLSSRLKKGDIVEEILKIQK